MEEGTTYVGLDAHQETIYAAVLMPGIEKAAEDLYLHPLKGERRGTWVVSVSGSWRITFAFAGPDVVDVDYEDYH